MVRIQFRTACKEAAQAHHLANVRTYIRMTHETMHTAFSYYGYISMHVVPFTRVYTRVYTRVPQCGRHVQCMNVRMYCLYVCIVHIRIFYRSMNDFVHTHDIVCA